MVTVTAYQHGLYPRSEAVVSATRDLDRGRTTPEVVDARYREDLEALVADQQAAGLDLLSDGLLRWQDLFRPLVEAADGLEATHLVRWFDTNTFFRAPRANDEPALDGAPSLVASGAEALPGPSVATLPSPYLFSRAADADGDRDALMERLARAVLRPVADALVGAGCALVHLEDPWIGFHGVDEGSWEPFERALGSISDGLGVPVVLHVYFGDASRLGDRLPALPVDAVGVDAVATDLDALGPAWPTGLLLGCLNGRNTPLEPVAATVEVAARVAERLDVSSLYLSSNSELSLLPQQVARDKLHRLGEIATNLEERLA